MKKYLPIAILLISLFSPGYSQDSIITLKNDTIDCKINKVSKNTIFFDVITKGVQSSGELSLNNILSYTISGKTNHEELKPANSFRFGRLRLGINGGLGYIISSSENAEEEMVNMGLASDKAKSYYKDMKSGIYANADLTYLITPKYGAGIKYKFFDTSGSLEGFIDPHDGVTLYYTTYQEHIYVNFIGASFFNQQFIGSQELFKLNSSISFGLAAYRDEAEYLNGYYLLTGKNIGFDASLGLEYFITRNFSVGADLSAFYSSIRKMKLTDGSNTTTLDLDKANYENISRIDLSFGIRLYLWNK